MDARLRMSMNDIVPVLKYVINLEFNSRKRIPIIPKEALHLKGQRKEGKEEANLVDPVICDTVKIDNPV